MRYEISCARIYGCYNRITNYLIVCLTTGTERLGSVVLNSVPGPLHFIDTANVRKEPEEYIGTVLCAYCLDDWGFEFR
jgi:hypothetical protein